MIHELYFTIISTTTTATITSVGAKCYEEDLRTIAVLIYQIKSLKILLSLWTTYLKSGTGQLHINQRGPSVWPTQVQTIVRKINNNVARNQNNACMQLVQERLDKFRTKMQQYEIQLDHLKRRLQGNKETVFHTIEMFIQQNQENFREKIDHKINLVQYDYNDRVLELQFLQQNPSDYCVRFYIIMFFAHQ